MEEDAMDEAPEHPICCCGCSQFLIIPFLGSPSSHWLIISFFVGPNCVKHTEHEKGVSIYTKFISPKYGCELKLGFYQSAHIPLAWQ
jgi:hypothetical protein